MSSTKVSGAAAERPVSPIGETAGGLSGGMDRLDEIPDIEDRLTAGIKIFV